MQDIYQQQVLLKFLHKNNAYQNRPFQTKGRVA